VPLGPCLPPYPFASANPRTSIAFNESEVLRAFTVSVTNNCLPKQIRVFYNDEHALTLGVRQVNVKTSAGTTTTDYPISALSGNPGSVLNPLVGSMVMSGDQAGTDVSGRPMFPSLYITDITSDPTSLAGDWQSGGTAIPPHAVFGTWKGAVRTVDKTRNPAVVTVTPDVDPAKNNWNLGSGDAPPAGLVNQGFGAEVRWETEQLGLLPGHTYRLYFTVHDGDQNKSGGDVGQGCATLNMGQQTDCGNNGLAALGDQVWRDTNGNGVQDAGEPGVSNAVVHLTDCAGMTLRAATTDANGRYLFSGLAAGSYKVCFTPPAGLTFTTANAGGDDAKDSDAEIATGKTGCYVLGAGQTNLTVDAGLVPGCRPSLVVSVECQNAPAAGQPLTFSGWINNDGDSTVDSITVSHSVAGLIRVIGTLAPGATTNFTGSYVPVGCGELTTAVIVSGRAVCNSAQLTFTEELTCLVPCGPPGLVLTKTADKLSAAIGGRIRYTYTVRNTGVDPLTSLVLTDDNGTPTYAGDDFTVGTIATLASGATATFTKELILPITICMADSTGAVSPTGLIITEVLASGNIKATFIQSMAVNDNTYGVNALNWPGGHTFGNLTGSDKAVWEFRDANGQLVLGFDQDYVSSASTAQYPSGYGTLGLGGDGGFNTGNAAHILSFHTSLTDNLNKPPFLGNLAQYTVNSPALADPNSGAWEYRMIYSVTISPAAFGAAGFGMAMIVDQHNSPTKPPFERGILPNPCASCITNTARVLALNSGLSISSTASAGVCATNLSGGGTGGTGCPNNYSYWQKNLGVWPAPYTSSQTVGSVFSVSDAIVADTTLFDALRGKAGGGRVKDLLKQGVVALLNAADPGINYPFTPAEVITAVNAALANGTDAVLKDLTTVFKDASEVRCP
jgi:hypothetical protein